MTATVFYALAIAFSAFLADDAPAADKSWIVIGPDNVIVAGDRAETQKLIDGRKKLHLLVSCTDFQLEGVRVDGKPQMKLQCKNVTVITADVGQAAGQMSFSAKAMTYGSATQTLELTEKVQIQFQGGGQELELHSDSLRLNFSDVALRVDVSGADVRLESFPFPVQAVETARSEDVLFFSAPWCGPCQTMQPVVGKLTSAGYAIETVNIDESRELVKRYNVTSIPQFIVLDGETVRERVVGIQSLDALKRLLKPASSRPVPPPLPEAIDTQGAAALEPPAIDFARPHVERSELIEQIGVIHTSHRQTDSEENSSPNYQPLIPDLFNAPSRKDDPNARFSFGGVIISR